MSFLSISYLNFSLWSLKIFAVFIFSVILGDGFLLSHQEVKLADFDGGDKRT
jgi:hypothetical protein